MVAVDSTSSVLPYIPDMPMAPRPSRLTVGPVVPSAVVLIMFCSDGRCLFRTDTSVAVAASGNQRPFIGGPAIPGSVPVGPAQLMHEPLRVGRLPPPSQGTAGS